MKPGPKQFKIYDTDRMPYQPDFVVEPDTTELIIDTKTNTRMSDPIVLRKADAACLWCHIATEVHGTKTDDKPWSYLLVPESAVQPNATINGLRATLTKSPDAELLSRFDLS
jgi:type III restriction enzyme